MSLQPQPSVEALPEAEPRLKVVQPRPQLSLWHQPRDADDAYVDIERRALPSLTSLRFFAAIYVVVHHLINMALLATRGPDADRASSWYLAWGTQGHVGVTFFFVLSGFILAWCYHRSFATVEQDRLGTTKHRFWVARFARVWPLHAAMFVLFVPLALRDVGFGFGGLFETAWQGATNLTLLHAWIPFGGPDGLSDTFNAPSWTLSVEACFYLLFPAIAVLLVRRLRWGICQLALLAGSSWLALGLLGVLLDGTDRADWIMRVLPATRLVDFVVGVTLGLALVQTLQRDRLLGRTRPERASCGATMLEGALVVVACVMPLMWTGMARRWLPDTLATSWFYLPVIAAVILVMARERGAISRRLLAARPLVWLGEVSYALYLVHMFILLAAFQLGAYDRLGIVATSLLVVVSAIAVSGIVHERFEKPARARLVARFNRS